MMLIQGCIHLHTNFQTSLEPRLMHNLLRRWAEAASCIFGHTFATQICDQMIHDIIKKLQTLDLEGFEATLNRARDRNRTGTVSLQQDFKSCASASSATRAYIIYRDFVGPSLVHIVDPCSYGMCSHLNVRFAHGLHKALRHPPTSRVPP